MDSEDTTRAFKRLSEALHNSRERLPQPPCNFRVKAGTFVLEFEQQTPIGKLEVTFTPSEGFSREALSIGEELTDQALHVRPPGGKAFGELEDAEARRERWASLMSEWVKVYFAHLLANNMTLVLRQTIDEAYLVAGANMISTVVHSMSMMPGIKEIKTGGPTEHLKVIVERTAKEKKDLLNSYLEAVAATNFKDIVLLYDALLPIWQDIQQVTQAHGTAGIGMVKAKYSNKPIIHDLPFEVVFHTEVVDDLLKRVTNNHDEISEAERTIIDDHDSTDTPSSMAVQHAARLCGAWRYQYSDRRLFQIIADQRNGKRLATETLHT